MAGVTEVLSFTPSGDIIPAISLKGNAVSCVSDTANSIVLYKDHEKILRSLEGHEDKITCLDFLADDTLVVTGSLDGTVKIWDKDECTCMDTINFEQPVLKLSCNPRHRIIAVELDPGRLKLRHLADKTSDIVDIQIQDDSQVTTLTQSEEQLIYGTGSGIVYVWNYEEKNCSVLMLRGHKTSILQLSVIDKCLLSLAEDDCLVRIWSLRDGKQSRKIQLTRPNPTDISLCDKSGRLVVVKGTYAVIYSSSGDKVQQEINLQSELTRVLCSNGSLLTTTTGGALLTMRLPQSIGAESGRKDPNGNAMSGKEPVNTSHGDHAGSDHNGDSKRRDSSSFACTLL